MRHQGASATLATWTAVVSRQVAGTGCGGGWYWGAGAHAHSATSAGMTVRALMVRFPEVWRKTAASRDAPLVSGLRRPSLIDGRHFSVAVASMRISELVARDSAPVGAALAPS